MAYFVNIFTILHKGKNYKFRQKGKYFMFRYKFTLAENGDYSILCINYQNGTIFILKQFLPKDVIEASKICFYLNQYKRLNQSSQLD